MNGSSTRLLAALALALTLLPGCGGSDSPGPDTPPPTGTHVELPSATEPAPLPPLDVTQAENLGPEDVVAAWITAQEEGDFGWAMSLLVESSHEEWMTMSDEMSTDDLISSGLQFRQDDYQLSFADDRLAVFWSDLSKLYLVVVREGKAWRIDPAKTDEMNHQASR